MAAYGVEYDTLSLLQDYLSNRMHRVNLGNSASGWLELSIGVPQGSILGPLLFNIFLNDVFFCIHEADICNFADDNTLYKSGKTLVEVVSVLRKETLNILNWFKINSMAANPAKFQVMFLGGKDRDLVEFCVDKICLKSVSSVKLLGVIIDSKLNFRLHVESLCKTASVKVRALLRIRPYLDYSSAKHLCCAYILSTFNYCPLIWMNGCKSNDALINKVHKRALSIVYRDFDSSFQELLTLDKGNTIHLRNLRALMTEVFKSLKNINPEFMWNIFSTKTTGYKLRSGIVLKLPPANTTKYGVNSLCFRGSILWNTLPNSLKLSRSLEEFRCSIKNWTGNTCTCHICS